MYDISGKRAIVTGGARGFGKEFLRRLVKSGAKVCISDLDYEEGIKTKVEVTKEFNLEENW